MQAMKRGQRLLGIALISSAIGTTGCEGPAIPKAPYPPDQVISSLTRGEVKGLYQVFRDFRTNGERVKEITPNGHLVRVVTSVAATPGNCPLLGGHPYDSSWVCEADVGGVFQLKNKFHKDGAGVNGGNVEFEFKASGDRIRLNEHVIYAWNAPAHALTVNVSYPGLPGMNFTRNWGNYNMKGTSTTKITTESTNGDVGFSLGSPDLLFSGSVTKVNHSKSDFVRILLDHNPYWANEGIVEFARNGFGTTTFGLGMDWLTDALTTYQGTVVAHASECSGQSKHSGSFQAKYTSPTVATDSLSAAIKLGTGSEVECHAWSETLAANLYFRATNATTCSGPVNCSEAVGERFRSYVRVRDLGTGNCTRQFDAALTAAVNWNLQLETSGGTLVTSFDLGSSTSVWGAASTASFANTYTCS